jgi:hypothetical protein
MSRCPAARSALALLLVAGPDRAEDPKVTRAVREVDKIGVSLGTMTGATSHPGLTRSRRPIGSPGAARNQIASTIMGR